MPRRKERNELVAGAFIILAGLLLVGVLLLLADWRSLTEQRKNVCVVFADQSVKGLDTGAKVEFNGVPVGQVTDVRLDYDNPRHICVTLSIPAQLKLYSNASLYIATGALGGNAWIEIEHVGEPRGLVVPAEASGFGREQFLRVRGPATQSDEPPTLAEVPLADVDHPVFGMERPNALISDMSKTLGFGDEQRTQLQDTMTSIQQSAAALRDVTCELRGSMLPQVAAMLPKVDRSLGNIEGATASGRALLETMNTKVPGTLDRVDDAVADIDKMLHDQQPVIADTIAKINSLATTLDAGGRQQLANLQKAMEQLQAALGKADASMENIRQFTVTARTLLETNQYALSDTIANFKQGSDQFAAGLGEIRREPWRLLYKPTPKEMAEASVMEAARAFAEGAANLRDAQVRLEAMLASRGEQLRSDDPQYRKLLADLQDSRVKFDKAEQALYQALKVPR